MTRPWPETHGMTIVEYNSLVARKGKQSWTPKDEERLKAKVRRIRKGGPDGPVR